MIFQRKGHCKVLFESDWALQTVKADDLHLIFCSQMSSIISMNIAWSLTVWSAHSLSRRNLQQPFLGNVVVVSLKGAFKYYISMFSQILDPQPPPKMLILYRQYKHFWSDPPPPTPPKRAYIILERSLKSIKLTLFSDKIIARMTY